MSRRRRRGDPKPEPLRCVCQPGPDAHHEHSKPGRTAAKRFDPRCPHWDRTSLATTVHVLPRTIQNLTRALRKIDRIVLQVERDVAPDT